MSTVTFNGGELRRVLGNAVLFTATPKQAVPVLESVRFEWVEGQLLVVACNRYVVSWEAASSVKSEGSDPFCLSVPDCKQVIGLLPRKPLPSEEVTVTYDPAGGDVTVSHYGASFKFTAHQGDYVRWQNLKNRFTAAPVGVVAVAPAWLNLLAKVDGGYKDAPVRFEFGGRGEHGVNPFKVTVGETFTVLVCPVTGVG